MEGRNAHARKDHFVQEWTIDKRPESVRGMTGIALTSDFTANDNCRRVGGPSSSIILMLSQQNAVCTISILLH